MDAIICPMCSIKNPADAMRCGKCRGNLRGGVFVEQDTDGLKASFRWFSWRWFLTFAPGTVLALLGSGLLIWLFSKAEPTFRNSGDFLVMILALGFLVWGLWGLYTVLSILLNRTYIEVAGGELRIHHTPLAARRECAIRCENLVEVNIEEVSKSAIPIIVPVEGGGSIDLTAKLFQLNASLANGKKEVLLSSPNLAVAAFLRSAIKKHSGLEAPISWEPD